MSAGRAPNAAALNALRALLQCGVSTGRLAGNYQLVGHRQLGATACPGNQLFNTISSWPHFTTTPRTVFEIKPEIENPDDLLDDAN
jgi:N-acetylmuramoyl-L-alanine amidase